VRPGPLQTTPQKVWLPLSLPPWLERQTVLEGSFLSQRVQGVAPSRRQRLSLGTSPEAVLLRRRVRSLLLQSQALPPQEGGDGVQRRHEVRQTSQAGAEVRLLGVLRRSAAAKAAASSVVYLETIAMSVYVCNNFTTLTSCLNLFVRIKRDWVFIQPNQFDYFHLTLFSSENGNLFVLFLLHNSLDLF